MLAICSYFHNIIQLRLVPSIPSLIIMIYDDLIIYTHIQQVPVVILITGVLIGGIMTSWAKESLLHSEYKIQPIPLLNLNCKLNMKDGEEQLLQYRLV